MAARAGAYSATGPMLNCAPAGGLSSADFRFEGEASVMWDESLVLAGRSFRSRLIVGTGPYASLEAMRRCHQVSGTEMVVVAVRRIDLGRSEASVLDHIETSRITLLPSTAGCYTAEEAVRTAYLAREAGLGDFIKVEVTGDEKTLYPDAQALLEATKTLAREGFLVLPSTHDDPVVAKRLEESGAAGIMVLGAPIGSGLGIRNPHGLRLILEKVSVPVIVDAGIGTASDAALAMELGCHGVLVNSAISGARDPEAMAEAMKVGVEAGRLAYRAGRIGRKAYAAASGPIEGVSDWAPLP